MDANINTIRNIKRKYSIGRLYQNFNVQKTIFVLIAVVPGYIGFLLFTLYPEILSIIYSFLDWDGISKKKFVGLKNYIALFKDYYVWRALLHNMILMGLTVVFTTIIALAFAYFLTYNHHAENKFHKVIFYLPNVLPSVVVALIWVFVFDGETGSLNALLRIFGINLGSFYWLGDKRTALVSLLLPSLWASVGFNMFIFMNAMTSIPKSLYEEADLNGANGFQKLTSITFPLILPVVRVAVLFMILGALKSFDLVMILTNGGPSGSTDVIALYIYQIAFGSGTGKFNFGYASTLGMFLFIIIELISYAEKKIFGSDDAAQY